MNKLYINNVIFKIFKKNTVKPFSELDLKKLKLKNLKLKKLKLSDKYKTDRQLTKNNNIYLKKNYIDTNSYANRRYKTKSLSIKKKLYMSLKNNLLKKSSINNLNTKNNLLKKSSINNLNTKNNFNKIINVKKYLLKKSKVEIDSSLKNYRIVGLLIESKGKNIYKAEHNLSKFNLCIYETDINIVNNRYNNNLKIMISMRNTPFIVNLFEYFETKESCYQIYNYYNCMNFYSYFKENDIENELIYEIIYKIFLATKQLHIKGIIHKNIKIENFLIDKNYNPLMKGFDISIIENNKISNNYHFGSPHYMAPELIKNKKTTSLKSDIWSLGILLYYLFHRDFPFNSKNIKSLFKKIQKNKLFFLDKGIDPQIKDLISNMLNKDLNYRYSIDECLNISYFKQEKYQKIKKYFENQLIYKQTVNYKIVKYWVKIGFTYNQIIQSIDKKLCNHTDLCYNIYLNN